METRVSRRLPQLKICRNDLGLGTLCPWVRMLPATLQSEREMPFSEANEHQGLFSLTGS